MKKITFLALAAVLALSGAVISCRGNDEKKAGETEIVQESANQVEVAIGRYLVDSIGPQYLQAKMCVPVIDIVDTNGAGDSDTLLVWGLFRVFNYDIQGDTLSMVSGGNHPGLLHLAPAGDGWRTVVAFDRVGDGAGYASDVRRIFGDRADALNAATSDHERCDSVLLEAVKNYVRDYRLHVSVVKEDGREPISLTD